jgi:predicted ATPase
LALAREQGFALWRAWATIMQGWALAAQDRGAEGVTQMRQGLIAWRATGAETIWPYWLTLLAEACMRIGQAAEGLPLLAEARSLVHSSGERRLEAEIHRLQGELLLAHSTEHGAEAETSFRHALDVARHQQAKSLELRAAISLAHLWQQQGQRVTARNLLAPIYGWFSEGFDTADLQEARALLDALA